MLMILLRCWNSLSLLSRIGGLTLPLLVKLSQENWSLIRSIKFFLLRLLFISVKLPFDLAWYAIVMFGMVLLAATWICQINYRNGYLGLLLLHLISLLNPCLVVEMLPAQVFFVGITLAEAHLNWLNWFHFLIFVAGPLVILIDCLIFMSPFPKVIRVSM